MSMRLAPVFFAVLVSASPLRAEYGLEPGGYALSSSYSDDGGLWRGFDSNRRWGWLSYVGDAYGASKPIYGTYGLSHSPDGFIKSQGDRPVTIVTRRRPDAAMPWQGYYGGRSYDFPAEVTRPQR
jgi:hypothetical protein